MLSQSRTQLPGPQILALMKKKPFSQMLGQTELTFSILSKKQKTFVLANDRFLLLKGIESLSYARAFPAATPLPLTDPAQLPPPKTTFPLSDLETFTNEQERLILLFSDQPRTRWEFICPSKVCALEWRKKLEMAVHSLHEFNQRKHEQYADYVRAKEEERERQSRLNVLLGQSKIAESRVEEQVLRKSRTQGGQEGAIVLVKVPDNSQAEILIATKEAEHNLKELQKPEETKPQPPPQVTPPLPPPPPSKPTVHLFKGPQLTKLEQLLLQSQPPQPLVQRSMSTISLAGKQHLKSQIDSHRRQWLQQLLSGQDESELQLDFQTYLRKATEVIINELHLPHPQRLYPPLHTGQDTATYELQDITLEIYHHSEQHILHPHPRLATVERQFANMDYLVEVTRNEGVLRVPFMAMVEYKGFVGWGYTRVPSDGLFRNRECLERMDLSEFEAEARISPEILLDEKTCKIVRYERQTPLSRLTQGEPIYFVQNLLNFLPTRSSHPDSPLLRPQLLQDEEMDEVIFYGKTHPQSQQRANLLLADKTKQLVEALQTHKELFTNSKELQELLCAWGLGEQQLGVLLGEVRQTWLQRILEAELAARSLRTFFRFDMQNCLLLQGDRLAPPQRQTDRERKRAVNFLNVVLGNTDSTFRLWRSLNGYSRTYFGCDCWQEDFSRLNLNYLLQALQTHLGLLLAPTAPARPAFSSPTALQDEDLARFTLSLTGFDLDYTPTFSQINDCIEQDPPSHQTFHQLCELLTHPTSSGQPLLELLEPLPLHHRINQFLLGFVSPDDNQELYDKIETQTLPSLFAYEAKLAEIRWFLKAHRLEQTQKPARFIQELLTTWLGPLHPTLLQLHRLMAENLAESQLLYARAVSHATTALDMARALQDGSEGQLWRDYYLLGRIHFVNLRCEEALPLLRKARELVPVGSLPELTHLAQLSLTLTRCCLAVKNHKQAYACAKDLHAVLRDERGEQETALLLENATILRQLLESNQQHESYCRFVETDLAQLFAGFAQLPHLFPLACRLAVLPLLKSAALRSRNRPALLSLIDLASKVGLSSQSGMSYLLAKSRESDFPSRYLLQLREADSIVEEVVSNQMMGRWTSFNKMSNQTLLEKINGGQLSRGFQFLAYTTALCGLLGNQIEGELLVME